MPAIKEAGDGRGVKKRRKVGEREPPTEWRRCLRAPPLIRFLPLRHFGRCPAKFPRICSRRGYDDVDNRFEELLRSLKLRRSTSDNCWWHNSWPFADGYVSDNSDRRERSLSVRRGQGGNLNYRRYRDTECRTCAEMTFQWMAAKNKTVSSCNSVNIYMCL